MHARTHTHTQTAYLDNLTGNLVWDTDADEWQKPNFMRVDLAGREAAATTDLRLVVK